MGFLKQFFANVFDDESQATTAQGFEQLSENELEAHLGVARYGDFELTDAVRPSYNLEVVPSAGFRHDVYRDEETPLDGARPDGRRHQAAADGHVHRALDAARRDGRRRPRNQPRNSPRGHTDLYREHIDMPILQSTLWDFEDLLINDGCTGIAVLNPNIPQEVQLDEHKLLIVYGKDLTPYESILIDCPSPAARTCSSSPKPSTSTRPPSASSTSSKN